MSPVRKLRYVVVGLNLIALGAIGVAAHALVRGPGQELGEFDPTRFALEDRVLVTRDLSVIATALDRPIPEAPAEAPPPITPTQTSTPPPNLTLVALLPDEADERANFAIVSQRGVQRLLKHGDVIQEGAEEWRVAAVRLEPLGEGTLGKLTLESERRVHTYEAPFRLGE